MYIIFMDICLFEETLWKVSRKFTFYSCFRYEWALLVWLSGLLLLELENPSDKSGLGWIKFAVLLCGMAGVGLHVLGMTAVDPLYWPTLMFVRNQMFALSFLLACVQILDFLSFHHLFGPWAIIIGDLIQDLSRFLAVLAIFVFGFSMQIVALNQPIRILNNYKALNEYYRSLKTQKVFDEGRRPPARVRNFRININIIS